MEENKKPSLYSAIADLELICQEIDNSVEISEALNHRFNDLNASVSERVDAAVWFRKAIAASIGSVKETADAWRAKLKTLEALDVRFDQYLLECISTHNGEPLRGDEGALAAVKNPPAIKYGVPLLDKSYTKILDKVMEYDIPQEYLEMVSFFKINTEAVKAALDSGKELSFAKKTQGERIKWSASPKGIVKT